MSGGDLRRAFPLLAAAAVIGYGALLITHTSRGVGASDASGYANTARDIVEGRIVIPVEAIERLGLPPGLAHAFIPLAHEPGPRPATMVPYYPPGFPLHIAFGALVAGWEAGPHVVNPVAALLCVVLTYVLGRQLGLSRFAALAGAAILAGMSVFLFCATLVLSDVPAALWSLAAVVCALRARRSDAWAIGAGAAFGMAVLVRPSNALLVLPLACALPWRPKPILLFGAAGLPFAGFYAVWNRTAFGSPFHTGYTHQFASELALSNFGLRFRRYGSGILMQLSPLVALGWLGALADRSVQARDRALLFLWFAPIFLFYCFWGPSDSWTYLRYILPAVPALLVGFLLALRDLSARIPPRAVRSAVAVAAVLVVFAFEAWAEWKLEPIPEGGAQAVYPEACRALAAKAGAVPALAVSMDFSGAIRFYTDLTPVRWDQISPQDFLAIRERAAARGEKIFALLMPYEVPDAVGKVPGSWVFLGNVRNAGLWELRP